MRPVQLDPGHLRPIGRDVDDAAVPMRFAPPFRYQSSRPQMRLLSAGIVAVGGLFLYLTRGVFDGKFWSHDDNLLAAFGLGVMLTSIGVLGLVFDQGQRVRTEPEGRVLIIEGLSRFGTKQRRIPFAAVERVRVRSQFVSDVGTRFFAVIVLKAGDEIQLMERSSDSRDIQRLCNDLARSIGCPAEAAD